MILVLQANSERAAELRALGEMLVANAHRLIGPEHEFRATEVVSGTEFAGQQLVQVRAWASSLERDRYEIHKTQDGFTVQATPPDDVAQALQGGHEDLELATEATRLFVRYHIDPTKESAEPIGHDELAGRHGHRTEAAREPVLSGRVWSWDASALVAAAALEAQSLDGAVLPEDARSLAAEIVLRIGEDEASPRQFEFEDSFFEAGADRSAARVLPLLLLPVATQLRAAIDEGDGWTTFERAFRAGRQSCASRGRRSAASLGAWVGSCLEDIMREGWALSSRIGDGGSPLRRLRFCVLGDWDPESGRPSHPSTRGTDHRVDCWRRRRLDHRVSARRGHTSTRARGDGRCLRLRAGPGPSVGPPRCSEALSTCLRARRGIRILEERTLSSAHAPF